MYLQTIEITHVSPCFADTSKIRLKAKLSDDVAELMPYINGAMSNAVYNPHAPNLTLYRDFRLITLHPQELTMIKALNTTDARQVLAWLQDLINDTAVRREEITPVYEAKQRPHPLQLYAWLPRTNCRQCGEKTCLAFAALLFCGQQHFERCAPMFTEDYREQREVMVELVKELGYDVATA